MTEKRWLGLILALFLILGAVYALVTPAFEASDELWHYPMIRHLADGNPLPVQVFDPAEAGPWKQEASQPPLYYYVGAALTFWIDTTDMDRVRRENPHVDNGLITEDGNINLVVHDPAANPWQGTLLAVRLVRLLSVLMGAVTVYLTYRIGKAVAPDRPELALGAAAANAFLPMFLFISGAVNNDNLAIMLASLALLMMIQAVALAARPQTERRLVVQWLLLGVVIGLALLTKEGTLGLLPLAGGTIFIALWVRSQERQARVRQLALLLGRSLLAFLLLLLPVVLIAGWWYWRNVVLYGDWLGWNAFVAVLGERAHPASLAQLWGERRGFMMSYWGLFGGVNVPMPGWVYAIFNALLLVAVGGFVVFLVQRVRAWWRGRGERYGGLSGLVALILDFVADHFALVASLLFAVAVVFGLIRWATTTWSSQGRLVFTALSALSVLFGVGLAGWLPRRRARWVVAALASFMFVVAALAPFLWIRPAYDPAAYRAPRVYALQPQTAVFGDELRLRRVAVEPAEPGRSTVRPGDDVWVHLEWEVLSKPQRDWSVFVHLNDTVLERPIAQRDMYLGQGLLLTSWLEPGQRLVNAYKLRVPETTVAPAELELATGLYDFQSGQRLPLTSGADAAVLARLPVEPAEDGLPNATNVNFENQLTLRGYELSPRRAAAGETLGLTLYWEARQPLERDYTFFAQVVGADTTRWASHDLAPMPPTSSWEPGAAQRLELTLPLSADTPPELYPLIIGVYTMEADGSFNRLQVMTEDGRLTDDFLVLTQVRVE